MPHLIFSINSGRSGSDYLYHLLSTARNATAFHEARPAMAGRRITRFPAAHPTIWNRVAYAAMYPKKFRKVLAIRQELKSLSPGQAYVETNHMFILSFYDVVLRHFRKVNVILLRRYLPKVIKSFLDLNMFTPEDRKTLFWTSSPNSPSAAVAALAPDEELDQVDRCIAYVIDIEARAQRFRRLHSDVPMIEVRLANLNKQPNVTRLFEQLKLETTPQTWTVMGQIYNHKTDDKESDFSEEYCLARLLQYIDRCREKGITLPDLPHLHKV